MNSGWSEKQILPLVDALPFPIPPPSFLQPRQCLRALLTPQLEFPAFQLTYPYFTPFSLDIEKSLFFLSFFKKDMYIYIFHVDRFEVFIEFITILFLFNVLGQNIVNLSSLTRDRTSSPYTGRRLSLNHWTTREVPQSFQIEAYYLRK